MKKIFFSIVALAALAACSKSEVQYDDPQEIGFAAVKGNVTKATGLDGELDEAQELGVWAYWDKDGAPEESTTNTTDGVTTVTPIDYAKYNESYLENALFKNVEDNNWGAPTGVSYPWPVNGALVFAGYTTPGDVVLTTNTAVEYALATDVMTFKNYANTNEFDLCWFGRTPNSYNNRTTGDAVTVELSHALTWVTIAAYGDETVAGSWKITSMTMDNVAISGTATCNGATKKATWAPLEINVDPITVGNANVYPHTITTGTTNDGVTTGAILSDNVLIPSDDVELTINYKFLVNGVEKEDSKSVTLNTETWVSGVHYTYTLNIKANEILIAPSYGDWATSDQTVTVE